MLKRSSAAALLFSLVLVGTGAPHAPRAAGQAAQQAYPPAHLPNQEDSLKFAVLGDFGTGSKQQYQLAAQMKRVHDAVPVQARHARGRQSLRL